MRHLTCLLLTVTALTSGAIAQPALSDDSAARLAALERENAQLRRENATLRERVNPTRKSAALAGRVAPRERAISSDGAFSANAAAIPVFKAAPAATIHGWTGFYIGVTAGGGWSRKGTNSAVTSSLCNLSLSGCPAFEAAVVAAAPGHFNTNASGFIGGGEIGYNWQMGRWVWGVEADFSAAGISGSAAQINTAAAPGIVPANSAIIAASASEKLDFLGTVRGRIGFTLTDPLLVYATGGLAYGHVTSSTTLTATVGGLCGCGPSPTATASASNDLWGWTVGGGLEWMFAPHWTVKGEYLHYDLGTLSYLLPQLLQRNIGGNPFFGITTASSVAFKGNIARGGINYKF